jgi:hypothetical protein
MNAVMIFGAPRFEGNFMAGLETISFSRRTLANVETPFCDNCLTISELQPPGNLRACTGNVLTFTLQIRVGICYNASDENVGKIK